jgi:hypothetical protein
MGQNQSTTARTKPASSRSLGRRVCLRKGCGREYQARSWNQRYCQDPPCLREVHRWQAAKRQQARRNCPTHRQAHAAAERQRRAHRRREGQAGVFSAETPRVVTQRKHSGDFCDRPGCYEPRRASARAPARYCGDTCRHALRRVRDREGQWLRRRRGRQEAKC